MHSLKAQKNRKIESKMDIKIEIVNSVQVCKHEKRTAASKNSTLYIHVRTKLTEPCLL